LRGRVRTIFVISTILFGVSVHAFVAWIFPRRDNRRSDRPFAMAIDQTVGDRPLYYVGEGPREDVLFYLGRTLPRVDSIDQLPPHFKGYTVVTSDKRDAISKLPQAHLLAESEANRAKVDKLYLFDFDSAPARR